MSDTQIIYIPGGRFVSGDLTKKRTQNARGQVIPEDKQQYEVGVAVPKSDPAVQTMFQQLHAAATAVCPANVHPYINNWFQTMQGFSMKINDGDRPSIKTGKANPNTQGCFVIYLSSSYPFNCYDNTNAQMDPAALKRGWYVDGTATVAYNGQAPGDGCGIYMNPGMFRCLGVGEEITGGMDEAAHMAAMAAPTLPPGAQPIGSAPAAPAMPGMGPAAGMVQQQPMNPAMQPDMPQAGVQMPPAGAGMAAPGQVAPVMQQPVQQPMAPVAPANPTMAAGQPANPAAGMAPMNGGVPAGVQQPAPAANPAMTAFPSSMPPGTQPAAAGQVPAHPGILNPPVPGNGDDSIPY